MRSIVDPPFPDGLADDWTVEWGQDKYGVFESFAIGGVVQRMRWIEPGRFWMGSPPGEVGRFDNEERHEVVLSRGYWLADTPCTQALWQAVMGRNPSRFTGDDRRPVEQVSWEDCQRFLKRLCTVLPAADSTPMRGMIWRLPTEAEWERACRANTQGATWLGELDQTRTGESKVLERIAWYGQNSDNETHRVAEKAANPFGLHDMLGNVYEWCEDWIERYDSTRLVDPCGPRMGAIRVLRGGSWSVGAGYCRAAYRFADIRHYGYDYVGFRLARGRAPSKEAEPDRLSGQGRFVAAVQEGLADADAGDLRGHDELVEQMRSRRPGR